MSEVDIDLRKASDVLISLEEKVLTLIKAVSANDMNNKLILDRLNKLLAKPTAVPEQLPTAMTMPSVTADVTRSGASKIFSPPSPMEVSQAPIINKKNIIQVEPLVKETKVSTQATQLNLPKIPVGQRITDNKGKDLFMADVIITNLDTKEVINKSKTNAVGKWQTYLSVGRYSISITKITDSVTFNKIESLQEIEITPQMKSLQLPIAIIKR